MPFAADTAGTLAGRPARRRRPTDAWSASTPAAAEPAARRLPDDLLARALPDPPTDTPARSLLASRAHDRAVDEADSLDVDTPEALAAARHRLAT
jgi:CTP:molybdopterin cytidylyltransferase MocA